MTIQELDIEILHRSGKHNANADALSRSPLGDLWNYFSLGRRRPRDVAALKRGDSELPTWRQEYYHVEADSTLQVIPPLNSREKLFQQVSP